MHATKSKRLIPFALGLSVIAATIAFTATPSSAAPAGNIASAISPQNDMLQQVQWRRHGGPYYGYRGGYRGGYRNGGYRNGGAVAAGVIGGLALGAMIGAASAAPPPPPPGYYAPEYAEGDDWLAYCSSKYRSFDPRSGTYLGYDGLRHPCQ